MPLNAEQVARLFAAGSVAIPPFPASGQLSAEQNAFTFAGQAAEPILQVVHYPSPGQKNTYFVPLRNVTAIFLPEGLAPGVGPQWFLGEDLRGDAVILNQLGGPGRPGTVFAPEDSGVLLQSESAMTAGEIFAIPQNCL